MSKKIIIIGPPNAGKTTLRRIFFEGENSTELIKYPLEPTHGEESLILKFREEIGIFDLAGQENQLWLEINKDSIFHNSKIIIIVIDITLPAEEIINFVEKILDIRNKLTPTSILYLLLHKIDLITNSELKEIRNTMDDIFYKESLLKIAYTSIKRDYFQKTFALFIDILKTCITEEQVKVKMDLNFFQDTIYFLLKLQENAPILKPELQENLKYSNQLIGKILDVLINKNYIEIYRKNEAEYIALKDDGIKYMNNIIAEFSFEEVAKKKEHDIDYEADSLSKKYPFLAFILSDNQGKSMVLTEMTDGIINKVIRAEIKDNLIDHELIPLFINALEKFSEEINIKNLPGFELKGTNLQIHSFKFELATVTLFMNSDTNIESMKSYIKDWFIQFIKNNEQSIKDCIEIGDVTKISKLNIDGKNWLEDLNKKYMVMALNSDIFDIKQVKELYEKLDKINESNEILSPKLAKKIKKLKNRLIKAAIEEDFREIKQIAINIKDIGL